MSALMHAHNQSHPVFLLEQAENWFLGLLNPVHTLTLVQDVARENQQATGITVETVNQALKLSSVHRRYMLSCRLQPELIEAIGRLSVKVSTARTV